MRFLIAALCLIATTAWAEIPKPSSLMDTLRLMQSAIVMRDGVQSATIDIDDQSIKVNEGLENAFTMFPDNLHRQLLDAPDSATRQTYLDQRIAATQTSLAGSSQGGTIYPVIRHRDYLSGLPADAELVSQDFIGDMIIIYAEDSATTVSYISPGRLEELGNTTADIHAKALANFRAYDHPLEVMPGAIYMLRFDGFYESSWLLMDFVWPQIENQIGPFVAVVPNRDLVLFAPKSNPAAIDQMRDIAEERLENGAYAISDQMLEWRNGAWVLY